MSTLWQSTIPICAVLLSILAHQTATAQDYPTKPVRIISGFGPGSAGDVLTRLVVPRLSQSTAQQFIIEYKPGNAHGKLIDVYWEGRLYRVLLSDLSRHAEFIGSK